MKKFALAAAALATVFSSSAIAAPAYSQHSNQASQHRAEQRYDNRGQSQQARKQENSRHWNKGERFDSRQAGSYRVIGQPAAYGLRAAPSGHRWVQSGNDAVLIGLTTGIVAAVLANAIH